MIRIISPPFLCSAEKAETTGNWIWGKKIDRRRRVEESLSWRTCCEHYFKLFDMQDKCETKILFHNQTQIMPG